MTSGYMNCPKCGSEFSYGHYEPYNGFQVKWVTTPEPWKCPKCKSHIIVDSEAGYGLKVQQAIKEKL